jgi:hypothetical protein
VNGYHQEVDEEESEKNHQEREISSEYDESDGGQERKCKATSETLGVWFGKRLEQVEDWSW